MAVDGEAVAEEVTEAERGGVGDKVEGCVARPGYEEFRWLMMMRLGTSRSRHRYKLLFNLACN